MGGRSGSNYSPVVTESVSGTIFGHEYSMSSCVGESWNEVVTVESLLLISSGRSTIRGLRVQSRSSQPASYHNLKVLSSSPCLTERSGDRAKCVVTPDDGFPVAGPQWAMSA